MQIEMRNSDTKGSVKARGGKCSEQVTIINNTNTVNACKRKGPQLGGLCMHIREKREKP
jgi:hypothetical protein